MTLNVFVLRKYRLIFELCQYFILFLSTSGAVSLNNRQKSISCGLQTDVRTKRNKPGSSIRPALDTCNYSEYVLTYTQRTPK